MNTKTDVYDYIVNNPDTYTLFKLGAPWCGPCKRVARPFNQLINSGKYSNVKVIELNVDNEGKSILALLNTLSVILEATHIVIPLYFIKNLLVPG